MSKPLEKIESRIQRLIEGAGKLLAAGKDDESFSEKIVRCMRENSQLDASGMQVAPDVFLVEINPSSSFDHALDHLELEKVTSDLTAAAAKDGILLPGRPEILIRSNPELEPDSIRISASLREVSAGNTAAVNILDEPDTTAEVPDGVFLIVNGSETIQLQKSVVNIGRRMSNDVILSDARVSRNHAQLRVIKGRYVIFDLNSRGGTYVNNLPVTQKELFPGDVITLAGVTIIYGQDSGGTQYEPFEQTPTNQLIQKKNGEDK